MNLYLNRYPKTRVRYICITLLVGGLNPGIYIQFHSLRKSRISRRRQGAAACVTLFSTWIVIDLRKLLLI